MKTKYLGFPIPIDLEERIIMLLTNMRATDDKTRYVNELYEVVAQLSNVGLEYFFVVPLQKAKIGMLKMKAIEMALSTGKKGILAVTKGILKAMTHEQLGVIIDLFEESLTVRPDADEKA